MCLRPELEELTLKRHRQATILQQEKKPNGVGGGRVCDLKAQLEATRALGVLKGLAATGTATPSWDGVCCLHPRRTPEQEAGAAALSRAWTAEGARGDTPRLYPCSWFKLVWAGCGPGRLHSRSQACRLPQGLPISWGPGAGLGGLEPSTLRGGRFKKIQSFV